MRDKTARDTRFPVACARCGGRISEPVAFCPHCGAHARFALAGATPAPEPAEFPEPPSPATGRRVEPSMQSFAADDFEGDLDEPWPGPPTPLFAGPQGDRYGEMRAPAFRGARQFGLKGGMGLVLAAFVVLYGSVVLLHRYDQAAPSSPVSSADNASKSVEGSIGANGGAQPPQKLDDSVPPDMSIANLPPPVTSSSAPRPTAAPAQSAAAPTPPATQTPTLAAASTPAVTQMPTLAPTPTLSVTPTPTFTLAPSPSVATGAVSPPSTADAGAQQTQSSAADDARGKSHGRTRAQGRAGDSRWRDGGKALAQAAPQAPPTRASVAARTLDNVQARLAKNDLSGARASLSGVLATDPRNGYALSLRDQLASREQARDASLTAARACVVQSRWHCVWHNAGMALSIDASSTEAKALVDRAIIESGAATAPAGPGPDTVEVPMVQ